MRGAFEKVREVTGFFWWGFWKLAEAISTAFFVLMVVLFGFLTAPAILIPITSDDPSLGVWISTAIGTVIGIAILVGMAKIIFRARFKKWWAQYKEDDVQIKAGRVGSRISKARREAKREADSHG